jgi:hypothetical protein
LKERLAVPGGIGDPLRSAAEAAGARRRLQATGVSVLHIDLISFPRHFAARQPRALMLGCAPAVELNSRHAG